VKAFSNWIELLMNAGISDSVRIMLYESRDSMYFKGLSKKKEEEFKYLQPDLDIAGAMNQILEETKAKKGTEEEKDMVSFQQALIKMNEAIGYSDEEDVRYYGNVCLKLAKKYEWQPQIALVHFFEHTFYASVQKVKEAHQAIDKAIAITAKAAEKEKEQHDQTQYQYYIAKGNLYFMSKEFEQAAAVYRESLELDRAGANPMMLAGIHQMLGNSLRKYATKTEARTCFSEGWQLLSNEGDDALKENTMAMFYAKDMLSVADQEMLNTYTPILNQLWGNNWKNNLTDQYNQLNKTK
jgi:tetratricopeptide (TPR) repeat protein